MLNIDKNDESLQKYKETLLGNIKETELKEDEAAEVEILQIEIVCPDRPKGNIILDFKTLDPKKPKEFKIKEGSLYCLRIHFMVRYDIVFGLKFVNNVYKLMAKGTKRSISVDKEEDKMGSFAPEAKAHSFDLPWIQSPDGFIARGDYKGKALFLDNDGIVHCQFDYVMTIGKDW